MSTFFVYLWTRLSVLIGFSITTIIAIITLTIVFTMYSIGEDSDINVRFLKSKITIILASISILILLFVPSKKDAAVIYVLPKIANSEIVQSIPEDLTELYKVGIKELKDSLSSDSPKVEKE